MANIGKVEVKLVWKNSLAGEAFSRVVARIRAAREIHDTVRPSELWDDLQTAVEGIDVQAPVLMPYQYTEQIGDYSTSHSFKTEQEMRRFEQKQKDGLWYDWDAGESNDPKWGALANGARLTDKTTGEEMTHVVFYHAETHYLERVALKYGNGTASVPSVPSGTAPGLYSPGYVAMIIETRELEFRRKEDS